MSRAFAEGAVDGRVPEGVFFNEKQCLQRDLTVLALRAFAAAGGASGGASGGLTILDAMSGCGVRALRYLLEVDSAHRVVACDLDARAVDAIEANALRNGLRDVGVSGRTVYAPHGAHDGAERVIDIRRGPVDAEMRGAPGTFDAVDIDPCGS